MDDRRPATSETAGELPPLGGDVAETVRDAAPSGPARGTDTHTRDGRSAEFMRLFVGSEPRIYAYIRSLVVDRTDAEEVLQQTATVSWMKFDQFQPGTDFVRWATRIAYWEVRSLVKRKRRDSLVFSEAFVDALASDAERASQQWRGAHDALVHCLQRLKQRDRDLFHLRYETGAKVKQIAEQVDRPLDTLHSAFRRIRRILTECIQLRLGAEQR